MLYQVKDKQSGKLCFIDYSVTESNEIQLILLYDLKLWSLSSPVSELNRVTACRIGETWDTYKENVRSAIFSSDELKYEFDLSYLTDSSLLFSIKQEIPGTTSRGLLFRCTLTKVEDEMTCFVSILSGCFQVEYQQREEISKLKSEKAISVSRLESTCRSLDLLTQQKDSIQSSILQKVVLLLNAKKNEISRLREDRECSSHSGPSSSSLSQSSLSVTSESHSQGHKKPSRRASKPVVVKSVASNKRVTKLKAVPVSQSWNSSDSEEDEPDRNDMTNDRIHFSEDEVIAEIEEEKNENDNSIASRRSKRFKKDIVPNSVGLHDDISTSNIISSVHSTQSSLSSSNASFLSIPKGSIEIDSQDVGRYLDEENRAVPAGDSSSVLLPISQKADIAPEKMSSNSMSNTTNAPRKVSYRSLAGRLMDMDSSEEDDLMNFMA